MGLLVAHDQKQAATCMRMHERQPTAAAAPRGCRIIQSAHAIASKWLEGASGAWLAMRGLPRRPLGGCAVTTSYEAYE